MFDSCMTPRASCVREGNDLDLRQLRYFVMVAELESFTAASTRLNVAQSALSRQIGNLEAELGVALFNRDGRRARLSAAGDRLRLAATKLLTDADELRAVVREADDELAGRVGIGADQSAGDVLLPRVFDEVQRRHPAITLDPAQALSSDVQEMLLAGRLDIALISFPDPLPGISLEPVAREFLYLAGSAEDFPLGDRCSVAEALALPLVVAHRPNRERLALEGAAAKVGLSVEIAMEVDGLALGKMLAARKRGYLLLPATALLAEAHDPTWRLSRIEGFEMTRYVARRATSVRSRLVAAVQEALLEQVEYLKAEGLMR